MSRTWSNIPTARLRKFYGMVMDIERKAYLTIPFDKILFMRCREVNKRLWDEIWSRP